MRKKRKAGPWAKCIGRHMKGGKMGMKDAAVVCKRELHMMPKM